MYQLAETAQALPNVSSVLRCQYDQPTLATSISLTLSRSIAASPLPSNSLQIGLATIKRFLMNCTRLLFLKQLSVPDNWSQSPLTASCDQTDEVGFMYEVLLCLSWFHSHANWASLKKRNENIKKKTKRSIGLLSILTGAQAKQRHSAPVFVESFASSVMTVVLCQEAEPSVPFLFFLGFFWGGGGSLTPLADTM